MDCFFASFMEGPCDFGTRGVPQACHLIPKQRLKKAGITDHDTLWSRAIVFPGCAEHHRAFDSRGGRLSSDLAYPDSVREFAEHHGFVWSRSGWVEGSPRTSP